MIQIARVQTSTGEDLHWASTTGEQARNAIKTSAEPNIEPGFFIDHLASRCSAGKSCSPYFRDSWKNEDESSDGFHTSSGKKSASLADYPHGWTAFEKIKLETCAVCADNLQIHGCLKWGASWTTENERRIFWPEASQTASETFKRALQAFFGYYQGKTDH